MSKKKEEPTFEVAMERLEILIDAMETGEIPLAEMVAKFEEGSELLQHCQKHLKDAELTIEKLDSESGVLKAVEPSEESDSE